MITTSRPQLAAELALLATVIEQKGTIPVLATVMLGCDGETLRLTATNLDTTLVCELPATGEPWGGCVPHGQLARLIKLLDGDEVELRPGKRLEIRCGSSKHFLPITPLANFPEVDQVEGEQFILPTARLAEMVTATAFALLPASDTIKADEFRFTGLTLRSDGERLEACATMKVVTAIAETALPVPPFEVIIPASGVAALQKLEGEAINVRVSANHAEFSAGPRTLTCRTLMGTFPDWRAFVPAAKYEVRCDPVALKAGLQRAMITMDTTNAVGYEPLRLSFTKEQVEVETLGTNGKSHEVVAVESNLNGEPLRVGVVGKQVLSVLREGQSIALVDGNQPLVFTDEADGLRLTRIVMPTSLRAWG
jgi:DNA polymerase-3 subunit beta